MSLALVVKRFVVNEQLCCEQLCCAPVIAWQRQVSPKSQNLCKGLLKHENIAHIATKECHRLASIFNLFRVPLVKPRRQTSAHLQFIYCAQMYIVQLLYRVFVLSVPPDFQYQNQTTCKANEELFYIEILLAKELWLAATCFFFILVLKIGRNR